MFVWACLLPIGAYAALRAMRFPSVVALGAAAATLAVFVVEDARHPAGLALGLLFLGLAYHAYSREQGVWLPAGCLAAAAVFSGHAALWAGASAMYFLYAARRPWRTLRWLALVGGLAVGLAGFHVASLVTAAPVAPSLLAPSVPMPSTLLIPFLSAAAGALAVSLVRARMTGGPDHRLLFLAHAVLAAGVLAIAAPVLRLSSAGFIVAAQVVLALAGAAAIGSLCARRPWALATVTIGLVLLGLSVLVRRASPPAMTATIAIHGPNGAVGWIGLVATLVTLLVGAAWPWLRRRATAAPAASVSVEMLECEFESAPARWGGLIPAALMVGLVLARLCGFGFGLR